MLIAEVLYQNHLTCMCCITTILRHLALFIILFKSESLALGESLDEELDSKIDKGELQICRTDSNLGGTS